MLAFYFIKRTMKLFYGIIFLGVVLGAVSGDINCFVEKQLPRLNQLRLKPEFSLQLCRLAREFFLGTQEDAKTCSLKRISVDEALSFTKDLCTVGWDLNNNYLKHETCLGKNTVNGKKCVQDFKLPENMTDTKTLIDTLKGFCSKLDGVYKCLNDEIGKPCGDEALQFTTRFTDALSSYTKGFCIEINGTSFIKLQWSILLGLLVALMIWYKY